MMLDPSRAARLAAVFAAASLAAACSTLPAVGPSAGEVEDGAVVDSAPRYMLVDIDARVVEELGRSTSGTIASTFGRSGPVPDIRIEVGDAVTVTIWESGAGALFGGAADPVAAAAGSGAGAGAAGLAAQAGARAATLPEQVVARDGTIVIPFAGQVRIAGSTPEQAAARIRGALSGVAMDPQVIVTPTRSVSGSVTVMGEVTGAARVPLSLGGDRLLDVIASAGGVRSPVNETTISLTRDGSTASVPLRALLENPAENVYARPGDIVTVRRDTESFTVLGATGFNGEVPIGAEDLSLAEALGRAAGLVDTRSDPQGVFLFRMEPRRVAESLEPRGPAPLRGESVPVVYRLDLSRPESFFMAQAFRVADGDVIYVTNAPFTDVQKIFGVFSSVTGVASPAIGIWNATSGND